MSVLFLTISVAAISLFYYVFSIPEPEGVSITDWPQRFTNNFSVWITYENGKLKIEEIGLKRLDEYGLWIQFFDEEGEESFSYNKPAVCDIGNLYHNSADLFGGVSGGN